MVCTRPYERLHEIFDYNVCNPTPIVKYTTKGYVDTILNLISGKPFICTETLKKYLMHFTGDLTF
jgi:hypothetical protein